MRTWWVLASGLSASTAFCPCTHKAGYARPWATPPAYSTQLRMSTAAKTGLKPLPKDSTFTPEGAKYDKDKGSQPTKRRAQEYEELRARTGGVWDSMRDGVAPVVVATHPDMGDFFKKEESKGNLHQAWPPTVTALLGARGISAVEGPEYEMIRRMFTEALSSKAVLRMQPLIETVLGRFMARWEKMAAEGTEIEFLRQAEELTFEIIAVAFMGPDVVTELRTLLPDFLLMTAGLFTRDDNVFKTAMGARERSIATLKTVVHKHRTSENAAGDRRLSVLENWLGKQNNQKEVIPRSVATSRKRHYGLQLS